MRKAENQIWPKRSQPEKYCYFSGLMKGSGRSALHVAREGADHAVFAAIFVAARKRDVLGLAEPPRRRIAVRAARMMAVDREGAAAVPQHQYDLAAGAVALAGRRHPRRIEAAVIEGIAIGRAGADRHCARRLAGRSAHGPYADAGSQAGQCPQ